MPGRKKDEAMTKSDIDHSEKEVAEMQFEAAEMTRRELYDEIWTLSVAGVAKNTMYRTLKC